MEFGRLFTQHARLLWVVAAAYVPKSLVEDVVQESAVTALARLQSFEVGTDFRAWMAQIVRFTAANAARTRTRALRLAPLIDEPIASTPADATAVRPDGRLRDAQDAFDDRVVAALADLSDDARACLLLKTVLDLPYADIAATLRIRDGTVASHVHRARETLRDRLARTAAAETEASRRTTR